MSSKNYLPPVADRNGELRAQLESIQKQIGNPDITLADLVRRFIREGIERYQKEPS